MITIRKWLKWAKKGIEDAIENAELADEEQNLLKHVLELHEKAINGDISYKELDKAIEKTPFWAIVDDMKYFMIFLGTEEDGKKEWYRGIKKKLKAINKGERGGWQFFRYKRAQVGDPPRGLTGAIVVFEE